MTTATPEPRDRIEFWFDPVCPWTWITSRWLVDVSGTLGTEVIWRPFSLAILNERKKNSPHREHHAWGRTLGQALIVAHRDHGNEAVGRLYECLGTMIHHDDRRDDQVLTDALATANLPADLHESIDSDRAVDHADAALRESTLAGVSAAGPGVGIPIISINGKAFFGPVVSPRPRGDAALKLWNAVYAAATVDGFYELKRGRDIRPEFS